MFKLKTERWGEVEVKFEHRNPDNIWNIIEHGVLYEPGTHCVIGYSIPKTKADYLLSTGKTRLVPPDQYCKSRGRKLALKRALYALGATRDERKLFWEAYFEAMKPKESK